MIGILFILLASSFAAVLHSAFTIPMEEVERLRREERNK